MIDLETLNRNLGDCIQQFPAQARHKGRTYSVWVSANMDMLQVTDSGIRDNMRIALVAVRELFKDRMPKSMDDIELLGSIGKWRRFQVHDVPDFFDDLSPVLTINLQSPDRGIE